jgi:uncharacterized RDD family membrane protein YckC
MKSNFEFEPSAGESKEPSLIDPEAYDASEQKFAASLERRSAHSIGEPGDDTVGAAEERTSLGAYGAGDQNQEKLPSNSTSLRTAGPEAWRAEVTARLDSYRARRRPRAPRYPSLQLKFEDDERALAPSTVSRERSTPEVEGREEDKKSDPSPVSEPKSAKALPESSARVLPFRRTTPVPPRPLEELAEPLQLFPRILDVPELAPIPPALGGILMEPEIEEAPVKRPGIEIPLYSASISRRILAALGDGLIVLVAFALFSYIFVRITGGLPPWTQAAEMSALILGILWASYQYLLLTYAGTTPGLKLAFLRLSRFDGDVAARHTRRWRALVSLLSALSLGLGYAWCLLDEDQLCWHDRMTKTHLARND